MTVNGNTIFIILDPDESPTVTFPDGYSFEQIKITHLSNIWGIYQAAIVANIPLIFPPVKSKSPCTLRFNLNDKTKKAEIRLVIEKFGQIPDTNYFNTAFEPILVTGDDGNTYPVIPSDQFK